jgi:hypothetical protein
LISIVNNRHGRLILDFRQNPTSIGNPIDT